MKVTIDIDATPKELRTFFGLPDVEPLQEEMLELVRRRMREGAEGYDPLSLLKPFLPQGMETMETFQRAFWEAFRERSAGGGRKPGPGETGSSE